MADDPQLPATTAPVALTWSDIRDGKVPDNLAETLAPQLPVEVHESTTKQATRERQQVAQARIRTTAVIGLRVQGYKRRQIAQMLGMTPNAVGLVLRRARASGVLNDITADLKFECLPLAIEGLNKLLLARDKDAIFKTLEGLGEFKSFKNITGEQTAHGLPPLQVNILNAPVAALPSNGVGTPREE